MNKHNKKRIIAGVITFLAVFGLLFSADFAKADYYNEGILKSTNILSGATVSAITGFQVTSAMEATASTSVQFSQDRVNFYDSGGIEGGWDICSDGVTDINISGLGWSGGILFYKLKSRTHNTSMTPTTTDIRVDYTGTEVPAASGKDYYREGFLVSTDLLDGMDANLNGTEKFGYNITSLPAGSAIYAQFSQDSVNWYNSSGTKWGWDTLSAGNHLEEGSALNLFGLGWSGDNFYYKFKFTTVDSEQTPVVDEIRLLKSATVVDPPRASQYTSGLVGYWSFNGQDMDWASTTAEALDRSSNSNNGDVFGAKAVVGNIGQALDFDGSDDYVECESVYNGVKTVAFWIKADNIASKKIIDIDGTDQIGTDASGNILATDFPAATVYVDGAVASTITTDWHFVVITDTTGVNASAMDIGRVSAGYFDGILDEVRVYDRALSADEIAKQYRTGARRMQVNSPNTNKLTSGLVGHWTFNGQDMDWASTTAEALDRSGNSNNGNVIDATVAIGKVGQALNFDGVGDYVDCKDVYDGVKTVSFWIKADDTSKKIINLNGTADIEVVSGTITANNFIGSIIYVDSSVASTIDTDWHYVAVVTDTAINANAVNIGRIDTGYFDGKLDEARIYNRVLSADEIGELYRSGKRRVQIKK